LASFHSSPNFNHRENGLLPFETITIQSSGTPAGRTGGENTATTLTSSYTHNPKMPDPPSHILEMKWHFNIPNGRLEEASNSQTPFK
ncbi:MAG: hypothetical protein KC553_09560, partial [Nitrospina sp.]|nr:hypothetical protein [Nitrospina sp.]